MQPSDKHSIDPEPLLAVGKAVIGQDEGIPPFKSDRLGQRQPVFGAIDGVLFGIEVDLHPRMVIAPE